MTRGRIKVLFIASWYPNRTSEVEGIFIQRHAEAVAMFCDVCVVHVRFGTGSGMSDETKNGVRAIIVYEPDPPRALGRARKLLMLPRYVAGASRAIARALNGFGRPDIVHVHHFWPAAIPAIIASRALRVPLIWTEHASDLHAFLSMPPRRMLARSIGRYARAILPVSAHLQRVMIEEGIRGSYRVVPNAIVTAGITPAHRVAKRSRRFLHASNLVPVKNVHGILDAAAILSRTRKDFGIDIVGDGRERMRLQDYSRKIGLDEAMVTFHGQLATNDVITMLQQACAMILNSNEETFSVIAAESLAAGTPVISTRCGGPEDFIDDEVGRLIPIGDSARLADAMDWMLSHAAEFDASVLSRRAAERFDYRTVGSMLNDVYLTAIAQARVGRNGHAG